MSDENDYNVILKTESLLKYEYTDGFDNEKVGAQIKDSKTGEWKNIDWSNELTTHWGQDSYGESDLSKEDIDKFMDPNTNFHIVTSDGQVYFHDAKEQAFENTGFVKEFGHSHLDA